MTPLISTLFALMAFSTVSMPTSEPKGPYSSNLRAKIWVIEAQSEAQVYEKNVQLEQYEKIVPLQPSEKSGQLTSISAYTSRVEETDSDPCTSANGANICNLYAQGTRICAANGYPFGTVLHVDGLGDCVVMDRMARKYGKDHVDWYFGYDLHGALQWGRQKRLVSVK